MFNLSFPALSLTLVGGGGVTCYLPISVLHSSLIAKLWGLLSPLSLHSSLPSLSHISFLLLRHGFLPDSWGGCLVCCCSLPNWFDLWVGMVGLWFRLCHISLNPLRICCLTKVHTGQFWWVHIGQSPHRTSSGKFIFQSTQDLKLLKHHSSPLRT